jgi:hypothetical protein
MTRRAGFSARQAVVASIVARRAMPEVINPRSAQAEKMLIEALRQGTRLNYEVRVTVR